MTEAQGSSASIRVLHLIASLGGGGAERQLSLLLRDADPAKLTQGICFYEGGPFLESVERSASFVRHLPRPSRFSLGVPRGIVRALREFGPDVVQTWLPYMDIMGSIAVRMTSRIPVIASERCSGPQYRDSPTPLVVQLRGFCLRHLAHGAVANSETGRAYLVDDLDVRAPVERIRNGLDIGAIDAAPHADATSLGAAGRPLLLQVGRLAREKNVASTIRALPRIVAAHPDLVLAICGAGELLDDLRVLADEQGVAERILWLGYRSDVASLMKTADVLVHSSFVEGDSNAAAEAAAARLPLCLSDIPAHREFAMGRDCCTFFDPGDSDALAASVIACLRDDANRSERSTSARELAESRSSQTMAECYETFYRRIRAIRSRP